MASGMAVAAARAARRKVRFRNWMGGGWGVSFVGGEGRGVGGLGGGNVEFNYVDELHVFFSWWRS